jgi:hypothetical protein
MEKRQIGALDADTMNFSEVPPGAIVSIQVSGPVVSDGRSRVRFTIARGGRVTQIDARVVDNDGTCRFPLLITELVG